MSWPVCVVMQYGLLGDTSLISLTVSVDVKHDVYCLAVRAEEGGYGVGGCWEVAPHVSRVDVASAACYVLTCVLSCSTG